MNFKNAFASLVLTACLTFSSITYAGNGLPLDRTVRQLTSLQKKALMEYGNRVRESMGILLTPPRGSISPDIKAARASVWRIIERLRGEELKQKGVQLVVNLYDSTVVNAFMGNTDAFLKNTAAGIPEITRTLLGFSEKGEPIYELALTTSILSKFKTEDALAFIISHELAHLFEKHVEMTSTDEEALKRWWSGQQREVVADYEGLLAMLGKYELSAAKKMFDELLYQEKIEEMSRYLSGLVDHHHPGVRLAMVEAAIENFRRTRVEAQPRTLVPLPREFKLATKGRQSIRSPKFAEQKAAVLELVNDYYLKEKPAAFTSDDPVGLPDRVRGAFARNSKLGIEQLEQIFTAGFESIQKSKASKQVKLDSLLKFLMYLDYVPQQETSFKGTLWNYFAHAQRAKMVYFMGAMATGAQPWTSDRFFSAQEKLAARSLSFVDSYFFTNRVLQGELLKLANSVSEWKRFLNRAVVYQVVKGLRDSESYFGAMNAINTISELSVTDDPLANLARDQLIRTLKGLDMHSLALRTSVERSYLYADILRGFTWRAENPGKIDFQFNRRIQQILKPATDAYLAEAIPKLINDLRDGRVQVAQKENALYNFSYILQYHSLPQIYRSQLIAALPSTVFSFLNKMDVRWNLWAVRYGAEYYSLYAEGLSQNVWSIGEKAMMFDFIARMNISGYPRKDGVADQKILNSFKSYLYSLDASDLQSMLHRDFGKGFDQRLLLEAKIALQSGASDFIGRMTVEHLLARPIERNRGFFALFGGDREMARKMAGLMTAAQFRQLVFTEKALEKDHHQTYKLLFGDKAEVPEVHVTEMSTDATRFLMEGFLVHQSKLNTLDEWRNLLLEVLRIAPTGLQSDSSYALAIENYARSRFLKDLKPGELRTFFTDSKLRAAFDVNGVAKDLSRAATELINLRRSDLAAARKVITEIQDQYHLIEDSPELGNLFRNQLLVDLRAQPSELRILFPDLKNSQSMTELTAAADSPVRGLSLLVGATQGREPKDQIAMVEYIMGRSDDVPAFVDEVIRAVDQDVPLASFLQIFRARMVEATAIERALVASSFFSGPNGMANQTSGQTALVNHILRAVSKEKRATAQLIAESLLEANADSRGLAFALVYSKKTGAGRAMSEGEVLSALLGAHGVPGIKFAQYLSFTDSMKEFAEDLADFQDAALPLNYFETLNLLLDRYGGVWPENIEVKGTLGSGSVNVAIELFDRKTQKTEVVSILRPDIEVSTAENFRKFNLLLDALAKRSTPDQDFRFLRGLSSIVEKSVRLEFDKAAALAMQKAVQPRYDLKKNGWTISSVEAYREANGGVYMAKATGLTAKKVWQTDRAMYLSAMRTLSQLEMDLLFGMNEAGNAKPFLSHANPDFHDGQVIIDLPSRHIQTLDYGQAVAITNAERDQAVELLRIAAGAESNQNAVRLINRWAQRELVGVADMSEIFGSSVSRMDRFVKLISELNLRGYEVPIAPVHWVMAANRQISLGEKIGIRNERVFKYLAIAQKLGLGQEAFNRSYLMVRAVGAVANECNRLLTGR